MAPHIQLMRGAPILAQYSTIDGESRRNHKEDRVATPITTKTHGVLVYATVPMLAALPRVLEWGPRATALASGTD
jgi:hypothetical protein